MFRSGWKSSDGAHAVALGGRRHELHEAARPLGRERPGIERRLGADHRCDQVGIDLVLAGRGEDEVAVGGRGRLVPLREAHREVVRRRLEDLGRLLRLGHHLVVHHALDPQQRQAHRPALGEGEDCALLLDHVGLGLEHRAVGQDDEMRRQPRAPGRTRRGRARAGAEKRGGARSPASRSRLSYARG